MDHYDDNEDVVDLGDVIELTRGNSLDGGDDNAGVMRKPIGLSPDE
ncbi:benenodin family lasso peptide [Sphingobium sp. Sx8-8]